MSLRDEFRARVKGTVVPMPTPFKADLSVDLEGVRRYTNFLIDSGIQVISPLGTTGEFFTMTPEEHRAVMKAVIEEAAGRAVVIAGAGHSGTDVASALVDYAQEVGADAVLVCAPYYYHSGPEAIFHHYRTLAEENNIGIVIYSNREFMENLELVRKLASLENIVGVKEATGSYPLYQEWCVRHGDEVVVIGGGSMKHYLWGYMWGSPAYFASVANFAPQVELDFLKHLHEGDFEAAKRIVLDVETPYMQVAIKHDWFPSLKAAQEMFGLPGGPSRLPVMTVSEEGRQELRDVLARIGLLKA
jgi:4-hydroxy-tetrahydrodipicolinate synthase